VPPEGHRDRNNEETEMEHLKIVDQSMLGARVYTADRSDLGTVKEVREGSFKVDAPARSDYWLPESEVESATARKVILRFAVDLLDEHSTHEPKALPVAE